MPSRSSSPDFPFGQNKRQKRPTSRSRPLGRNPEGHLRDTPLAVLDKRPASTKLNSGAIKRGPVFRAADPNAATLIPISVGKPRLPPPQTGRSRMPSLIPNPSLQSTNRSTDLRRLPPQPSSRAPARERPRVHNLNHTGSDDDHKGRQVSNVVENVHADGSITININNNIQGFGPQAEPQRAVNCQCTGQCCRPRGGSPASEY
ncbi:hypothetical protein BDV96DRAFT_598203 [Lophiotrema nucula]|uniref:Uncharacterized protein n=1 Tax=Lophiotrema nucula TaxID=690887 RepID=A0A6A5ZG00_9PLEO|nr:hypothetical protein BDV96DRAFT_598203 [Lophiotrema nucula]